MKRSLPLNNKNSQQPAASSQQQQPHSPPRREATIDDLPDELLGLIFRQLPPWLQRVRVEGVSKRFQRVALTEGWTHVREFNTEGCANGLREHEANELHNHPSWWGPLLSRVGPHLTTLELGLCFTDHHNVDRRGEALRVELEKCPRVKHLRVRWELLDPPTALEHIGRAYATTLKSLMIVAGGCSVQAVRSLSETLSNLSALECLEMHECLHLWNCKEKAFMQELHLSARSLANLRHLALHSYRGCILSEENIDVVVALPRLRSFTLNGFHQFSFLKRFPHLEHLYIGAITDENTENTEGLIEALPHLGRSLKALRFSKYANSTMPIPLFEQLLGAMVEHLPKLEHLTLSVWFEIKQEVLLLQKGLLDRLASSPVLQNLRSLSLLGYLKPLSWSWLEGMSQRLEYLELGEVPPLSTLCSIVRNGKNLHRLNLCNARLSAADRKLLVEVSLGQSHASTSDDGEKMVQPVQPMLALPILHIAFKEAHKIQEDNEHNSITSDSRVRFCQYSSELRSHVLELYRFGCLSEGRPSFIRY